MRPKTGMRIAVLAAATALLVTACSGGSSPQSTQGTTAPAEKVQLNFWTWAPGLVTVFLFQFVAIWNNFMLPYIMLGNDRRYPITVGLSGLLNQGASQPAMYTSVVTGALLSIIPLVALFLSLQRYWQVDLAAGAVKA